MDTSLTLPERFDREAIQRFLQQHNAESICRRMHELAQKTNLLTADEETEPSHLHDLPAMEKLLTSLDADGYKQVTYIPAKRGIEQGRLFAQRTVAYQSLPGWFKGYAGGKRFYHDLDIVNAYPVLLYTVLSRHNLHNEEELRPLQDYIFHREKLMAKVAADISSRLTRADTKRLFLIALHNGNPYNHLPQDLEGNPKSDTLDDFVSCVSHIVSNLRKLDAYRPLWEEAHSTQGKNHKGRFISWVAQTEEMAVFKMLTQFLKERGWVMGPYIFDGGQVERKEPGSEDAFSTDLLEEFAQHMLASGDFPTNHDGRPALRIEEKPFEIPAELITMLQEKDIPRNCFHWGPEQPLSFEDWDKLAARTDLTYDEWKQQVHELVRQTVRRVRSQTSKGDVWLLKESDPGCVTQKVSFDKITWRFLQKPPKPGSADQPDHVLTTMKASIATLVTSVAQDLIPYVSFRRVFPFPVLKTSKDFSTWPGLAARQTDNINYEYVKWLQYITRVHLCRGCPYKANYLICWLRRILTHVGALSGICICINGPAGIGKSIIMQDLMALMIGEAFHKMTGVGGMSSRFNTELYGKVYVCLEEAREEGNFREQMNALKEFLTSNRMRHERKYMDVDDRAPNGLNVAILSNDANPLPMIRGMPRRIANWDCSSREEIMTGGSGEPCDCGQCNGATLSWDPAFRNAQEEALYWQHWGELVGSRGEPGSADLRDSIYTWLTEVFVPPAELGGEPHWNSEAAIPRSEQRCDAIYQGLDPIKQWAAQAAATTAKEPYLPEADEASATDLLKDFQEFCSTTQRRNPYREVKSFGKALKHLRLGSRKTNGTRKYHIRGLTQGQLNKIDIDTIVLQWLKDSQE